METTTQINRRIKAELTKLFPAYTISLRQEHGWKDIYVSNVPKPDDCRDIIQGIKKQVWDLLQNYNEYIGSFYTDDGYLTPRWRVIISVEFKD